MKAVTLGQCNLKQDIMGNLRVWSVRSVNGKVRHVRSVRQ